MGKGKQNNNTKGKSQKSQPKQPRKSTGVLKTAGSAIGGYLGGPIGGVLGGLGGDILSKITGFGTYHVNHNTIHSKNAIPSFYGSEDGMEVCHREYLYDINGSTDFTVTSLPINPGLAVSFPWLSQLAGQFELYEMLGLVYEFRPLSGMAVGSTSASLGVVAYATNYNVAESTFTSKQAMESYEFSTSTVPFDKMLHPVECAPGSSVTNNLYVRNTPVSDSLQLYDLGNFQYATTGMQSVYTVGELWVSYHVRLKRPRIDPSPTSQYTHFQTSPAKTVSQTNKTGTAGLVAKYSGISAAVSTGVGGFYLREVGSYFVQLIMHRNAGTITTGPSLTVGANITALSPNLFARGDLGNIGSTTDPDSLYSSIWTVVTAGKAAANFLTVAATAGTLSNADMDVFIWKLPYGFQ